MTTDAHPEYAKRLDISQFIDTGPDSGHLPDCPSIDAYDNVGCSCAWLLLTEVRRLSAINSKLVREYNDLLIRNKVSLSSVGLDQVGEALSGLGGQAIALLNDVTLIDGEPVFRVRHQEIS